jgi:cytochrome b561
MQTEAKPQGYGWLAIALHWIAAFGVLAMLWIGLNADWAGDAGNRAERARWMGLHISLGATLIAFFAARVVGHYTLPQPAPAEQARPLQMLAKAAHHLLLLAIVILILSGPMAVFSGGRDINVWGLFAVPSPFAERNDAVHEAAEQVHAVGRYMLYGLIPLHVLGALKHLIVDRDGVFMRMLRPSK